MNSHAENLKNHVAMAIDLAKVKHAATETAREKLTDAAKKNRVAIHSNRKRNAKRCFTE